MGGAERRQRELRCDGGCGLGSLAAELAETDAETRADLEIRHVQAAFDTALGHIHSYATPAAAARTEAASA